MNKNNILLTRIEFKNQVFSRDKHKCICCGEPAIDAHHIMDRKLYDDGGYYFNNGASVCSSCHLKCEQNEVGYLPWDLYYLLSINKNERILPKDYNLTFDYDKWGTILSNYSTEKAEYLIYLDDDKILPCTMEEMIELETVFGESVKYVREINTQCIFEGTIEEYFNKK